VIDDAGLLEVDADTEEQAHFRMAEKGRDAARVAIEMANLLKRL